MKTSEVFQRLDRARRGPSRFFLLPLHLYSAIILLVLIVLHILAALYHQSCGGIT